MLKLRIKKLLVRILLLVLGFFIVIKKVTERGLSKISPRVSKAIGAFFQPILFFLYKAYITPRTYFRKFLRSRAAHPAAYFVGEYIIHAALFIIFALTVVSNVEAAKVSETSSNKSIVFNIVPREFNDSDEELVLVSGTSGEAKIKSYLGGDFGVKSVSRPDDGSQPREVALAPTITQEGGAVIKPHVAEAPSGSAASARTPVKRAETETYIVQSGDVIINIAEKFGVSVNTILWENKLTARSVIKPGQKLTILPVSGVSHKVKKGESLGAIAKKYGADAAKVLETNKLANAAAIQVGQVLLIPDGKIAVVAPPAPRVPAGSLFGGTQKYAGAGDMFWPSVCKRITQYYTWRHLGVDIACRGGGEVVAADGGKVIFSGWAKGYGNSIVIDHGNGRKTRYGHFSQRLVQLGETVARGQSIGIEGSTGWSTGPHLHFEVIVSGVKKNPLNYIR